MQLTIIGFSETKQCDNCGKATDSFHVQCEARTLDAELCAKCLARQCKMREKAKSLSIPTKNGLMIGGGSA
jgi:hypothetical protein